MSPSTKKTLNIISYALNAFFIVILIYGLGKSGSVGEESKMEGIKNAIIEHERAELPLTIQEFKDVHSITIEDFVFTGTTEPYSGYLVTTWDYDKKIDLSIDELYKNGYKPKYERTQKEVYVPVPSINLGVGTKFTWSAGWTSAHLSLQ